MLETPPLPLVVRTLGSSAGADQTHVMQAVARMVNWVKVTKEISATEFPQHDLLSALKVVCLRPAADSDSSSKHPRRLSAEDQGDLRKLAQCLNVDAATLTSQTQELLPIAHHEMNTNSTLTSVGAWRKALARAQQNSKTRKKYPVDALRRVLEYYAIASASTSGIERTFGAAKRNLGENWNGTPVAEERRLILALAHATVGSDDRESLAVAARVILAQSFGAARETCPNRLLPRISCRRDKPRSHATWLKNRRLDSTPPPGHCSELAEPALETLATELWTEKQTREVARQQRVRKARKVQAALEGLDVLTPELQTEITAERAAAGRRQRALIAQHRRSATIRSLPVCNIEGKTVWVDPAVDAVMKLGRSAWWTPKRLRVVDRREFAHVLVVQDAAKPGGRSQTVAHLRGCLVTNPEYFLSPPGSALQWKAALRTPRTVYLSDAVLAAHKPMVDVILATAKSRAREPMDHLGWSGRVGCVPGNRCTAPQA